jgi:hypothetical protein
MLVSCEHELYSHSLAVNAHAAGVHLIETNMSRKDTPTHTFQNVTAS